MLGSGRCAGQPIVLRLQSPIAAKLLAILQYERGLSQSRSAGPANASDAFVCESAKPVGNAFIDGPPNGQVFGAASGVKVDIEIITLGVPSFDPAIFIASGNSKCRSLVHPFSDAVAELLPSADCTPLGSSMNVSGMIGASSVEWEGLSRVGGLSNGTVDVSWYTCPYGGPSVNVTGTYKVCLVGDRKSPLGVGTAVGTLNVLQRLDLCDGECTLGYLCDEDPTFNNGTCRPLCGDGFKMPEEECDDGDQLAGDGCSGRCTIEPGFVCEVIQAVSNDTMLNDTDTGDALPSGPSVCAISCETDESDNSTHICSRTQTPPTNILLRCVSACGDDTADSNTTTPIANETSTEERSTIGCRQAELKFGEKQICVRLEEAQMVAAEFVDGYAGIRITFDVPIDTQKIPLADGNCSNVLADESVLSLGVNPLCSWVSSKVIYVQLGAKSLMKRFQLITIKAGVLQRQDAVREIGWNGTSDRHSVKVTKAADLGVLVPTVVLKGAKAISSCAALEVTGIESTGHAGRLFENITWTCDDPAICTDELHTYLASLPKNETSSLTIEVPPQIVFQLGQHNASSKRVNLTLSLRITNFLAETATDSFTVSILIGTRIPVLDSVTEPNVTIQRSSSLLLEVAVSAPASEGICESLEAASGSSRIMIDWTSEPDASLVEMGFGVNPRILRLPPSTLEYGSQYVFAAAAYFNTTPGDRVSIAFEVTVLPPAPPIALLVSPSQASERCTLILDGSGSYDPAVADVSSAALDDNATDALVYSWFCSPENNTDAGCFARGGNRFGHGQAVEIVTPDVAGVYRFMMNVTALSTDLTSSAFARVKVSQSAPPPVSLTPLPDEVSPQLRLDLSGSLAGSTDCSVDQYAHQDRMKWLMAEGDGEGLLTYNATVARNTATSGLQVYALAGRVPPFALTAGVSYTLRFALSDAMLDDEMAVTAVAANATSAAELLQNSTILKAWDQKRRFKTTLPPSKGRNESYFIVLGRVEDSLGSRSMARSEIVTVRRPVVKADQLIGTLDKIDATSDPSAALNSLQGVSELLVGADETTEEVSEEEQEAKKDASRNLVNKFALMVDVQGDGELTEDAVSQQMAAGASIVEATSKSGALDLDVAEKAATALENALDGAKGVGKMTVDTASDVVSSAALLSTQLSLSTPAPSANATTNDTAVTANGTSQAAGLSKAVRGMLDSVGFLVGEGVEVGQDATVTMGAINLTVAKRDADSLSSDGFKSSGAGPEVTLPPLNLTSTRRMTRSERRRLQSAPGSTSRRRGANDVSIQSVQWPTNPYGYAADTGDRNVSDTVLSFSVRQGEETLRLNLTEPFVFIMYAPVAGINKGSTNPHFATFAGEFESVIEDANTDVFAAGAEQLFAGDVDPNNVGLWFVVTLTVVMIVLVLLAGWKDCRFGMSNETLKKVWMHDSLLRKKVQTLDSKLPMLKRIRMSGKHFFQALSGKKHHLSVKHLQEYREVQNYARQVSISPAVPAKQLTQAKSGLSQASKSSKRLTTLSVAEALKNPTTQASLSSRRQTNKRKAVVELWKSSLKQVAATNLEKRLGAVLRIQSMVRRHRARKEYVQLKENLRSEVQGGWRRLAEDRLVVWQVHCGLRTRVSNPTDTLVRHETLWQPCRMHIGRDSLVIRPWTLYRLASPFLQPVTVPLTSIIDVKQTDDRDATRMQSAPSHSSQQLGRSYTRNLAAFRSEVPLSWVRELRLCGSGDDPPNALVMDLEIRSEFILDPRALHGPTVEETLVLSTFDYSDAHQLHRTIQSRISQPSAELLPGAITERIPSFNPSHTGQMPPLIAQQSESSEGKSAFNAAARWTAASRTQDVLAGVSRSSTKEAEGATTRGAFMPPVTDVSIAVESGETEAEEGGTCWMWLTIWYVKALLAPGAQVARVQPPQ
ncbi:unnamed protein product [Vitrella brassicaformis CCMP3155]|uniref:PKD/REJ-like domain-containing protein n=1 Tax=Vitrella brassicaformis (strain CCMP3155) TaxID=1169540 RepID=A0A0G4F237_VITBC|nr:unnamed protein product [Vitrella brassicaformis CCMP3155]|eukprot:CEM05685.1 unnamed protein product [Vitrella brassicaformis CCMP3155]